MNLLKNSMRAIALLALISGAAAPGAAQTVKLANLAAPAVGAPLDLAPLDARASALRAAVAGDHDLAGFYQSRNYAPFWFGPTGAAAVAALLAAIEGAETHALPRAAYHAEALAADLATARGLSGDARLAAEVRLELELSRRLARFGGDLAAGALQPRRVDREINVFPARPAAESLLAGIAQSADPAAYIAGLAPASRDYRDLRALYARLATLRDQGGWDKASLGGGSLRPGDRSRRVIAMRERLVDLGDAPAVSVAAPDVYDEALERAVLAFQIRHGLNADGVAGRRTFQAMNVDVDQRLRQIAVNLERIRWLNRDLGKRRIMVNLADFRMTLMDGDAVLQSSRVVVGKSRKFRTPEFSEKMTHMVVNPTWNVPRSIATREILPKLREDPGYLARNNMSLVPRAGAAPLGDPATTDWSLFGVNDFPFRIKQAPGRGNALGKVKFMFPNQFNIYLHDTPSKSLFRKDSRAFSHGCVRVENPFDLAYKLLAAQEADPEARFTRWLNSRRETYVNLDEPVQVHLTYRTVWVDENGQPQYRADIYGRDRKVFAALTKAGLAGL